LGSIAGEVFLHLDERALIDVGNNIIKSQCVGSILLSRVALGTPAVHKVPAYRKEKSMWNLSICPSIHISLARKMKGEIEA